MENFRPTQNTMPPHWENVEDHEMFIENATNNLSTDVVRFATHKISDANPCSSSVENKKRVHVKHSKSTRKRTTNKELWKSVQQKSASDSGKELRNDRNEVVIKPRLMKESFGKSCTFRCLTRISEMDRQKIFKQFWSLASHTHQWNYIFNLTTKSCEKSDNLVEPTSYVDDGHSEDVSSENENFIENYPVDSFQTSNTTKNFDP